MVAVLLLVGFVLAVLVVLAPIALARAVENSRRIRELQREIQSLRQQLGGAVSTAAVSTTGAPAAEGGSAAEAQAGAAGREAASRGEVAEGVTGISAPGGAVAAEASQLETRRRGGRPSISGIPGGDLESIIGGRWLAWIGVLAIFFGTAFFVAIDLGEHPLAGVGQVLTGLAVGVGFVLAGRVLAHRVQRVVGQGLLGGGIALLYLAAYAAHGFHHLVAAPVAYVVLFGIALIGAAVALVHDALAVAVLTLAGALLTPPLLETSANPLRLLMPYLVLVNLGSAVVSTRRAWPALPLLGFFGSVVIGLWWWEAFYSLEARPGAALGFGALWLVYALLPFVGTVRQRLWKVAHVFVIVLNGLVFVWLIHALLAPDLTHLRGLATTVVAIAYVIGARLGRRRGSVPAVAMTHYTGIAIATVAVPIQFDAAWTTVGWALLGLVLTVTGVQQDSRAHRWCGLAVLGLALVRALFMDTAARTSFQPPFTPIFNASFLAAMLVLASLVATAWLFRSHRDRLTPGERAFVSILTLTTAASLLWRLSIEVYGAFHSRELAARAPGSRRLALLLTLSWVWAAYGALLILGGFLARYRPIRILGVLILGVLVVKVFLVDMQALERGYRVASFIGVGILLLVISLIYQRGRQR